MINVKLGLCALLIAMSGCAQIASVNLSEGNWIKGDSSVGALTTIKRLSWVRDDNYWYRLSTEGKTNSIDIQIDGELIVDDAHPDQIPSLANGICFRLMGTPLKAIASKPSRRMLAHVYPQLITASCFGASEYAERIASQQKLRKQTIEKQERERIALQERQTQLVIDKLKLKQEDCVSFGFKPKSTDHADCVMKLTIAERQQQKDAAATARLASLRRAQLAQQQEADSKAAEQEKRRRDGALLMGIGGNISAGRSPLDFSTPKESTSEKDSTPLGYKNCRYRVAGGVVSVATSNAQVCASTRQFDGNVGYLTQ